jgi:hypothetical protein
LIVNDFLAQYRAVEQAARAFIVDAMINQLTERERGRVWAEDFGISNITENGIEFVTEYNDACGCHPEYQNAYVLIPWSDIQSQYNPPQIES